MSVFSNFFHVKESPILSMLGFGGGGTGTALGGAAGGSGIEASGGQQDGITPGNGYKYHTFTTTGAATFTVTAAGTGEVDVFIVAGGGRGETGGGGAGTVIYKPAVPISAQAYPLTIGAGGGPTGSNPLAVLLVLIQMPKVVTPLHLDTLLLAVVMVVYTTRMVCMATLVDLVVVEHRNGGGTAGNVEVRAGGTSGGSGGIITPNAGWGNAGGDADLTLTLVDMVVVAVVPVALVLLMFMGKVEQV